MQKIRDFGELERYRRKMGGRAGETPEKPSLFFWIVRVAACLACIPLFVSFVITFLSDIVNPGNVIGSAVCICIFLITILYPVLFRHTAARTAMRIIGVLITLFVVYSAVISGFIVSGILNKPSFPAPESGFAEPTHTVIVLGCQTKNGKPSLMLETRLKKTIEYANAHTDCVIIVTGGQGDDEIEPEAKTMRAYLIDHGIEPERIYEEDRSLNTRENMRYSNEIIKANDLPRKVVVISEIYHVYRGCMLARHEGLTAYAVYADSSRVRYAMPTYWVREIFGISRDYLYAFLGL